VPSVYSIAQGLSNRSRLPCPTPFGDALKFLLHLWAPVL